MSHEEQHMISRRDVLRTGAVAGVAAALGGAGAAAAVPATAAPGYHVAQLELATSIAPHHRRHSMKGHGAT